MMMKDMQGLANIKIIDSQTEQLVNRFNAIDTVRRISYALMRRMISKNALVQRN